jgi:UTP--glucose-1-phosphate uridylyltransferase
MKQMMELFEQHGGAIVAVTRVARENVHLYGIVDAEEVGDRLFRIHGLVEKPTAAEAPSTLAVIGRYILPPEVFSILKKTSPGAAGEIQLTDALIELTKTQPVYGFEFPGDRYDAGDKLGHLIANVVYALKDPELGTPLKTFLAHLKLDE